MPNFLTDRHSSTDLKKKFPSSMFILGQKSCFLGPTIFEIPQPNKAISQILYDQYHIWNISKLEKVVDPGSGPRSTT